MTTHALILTDFHFEKKHPHTIFFDCMLAGSVSHLKAEYTGAEFKFDYISPEINKKHYNIVLDFLNKHYGYGPFERKKVKEALKEHFQIRY